MSFKCDNCLMKVIKKACDMTTVAGIIPVHPTDTGCMKRADGINSQFVVVLSADADE